MNRDKYGRRTTGILAVMAAVLLLMSQFLWMLPAFIYAETAGDELVVRVQYYGEIGDKIREKARFSRSELESMGAYTYYYSNITRVGTVMSMAARGPEVMTIIENAGIDPGSIQNITFRTTDGYTRNFTVSGHLTATKYYYPNLNSCYERNEEGNALTPTEGALEGRTTVPAILALEFGESKMPGIYAEDLTMGTDRTYRFCMGQSDLTEGQMTNPNDGGGDISSMESCHSIYGIDITLAGSPIYGMSLDLDDPTIKVGSMKQISLSIDVEEAFEGAFTAEDLIWTSSDESIAEVNSMGEVTVHKQGSVTITATAPDGTSASVTVNGVDDENEADKEDEEKSTPVKQPEQTMNMMSDEQQDNQEDREPDEQQDNQEDREPDEQQDIQEDREPDEQRDIQEDKEPDEQQESREDAENEDEPENIDITDTEQDKTEKTEKTENEEQKEEEQKARPVSFSAHEILLGDVVVDETSGSEEFRSEMAEDAQALDAASTYDPAAAAGTAAGAGALCGAGAIARIIRYRRDF